MVNQDSTWRLPTFDGMRRDDVEQHWFTYESIWSMKTMTDEATNIAQLETTFKDKDLTWYMKYMATTSMGQERSLMVIKRYILKEFQKPKSESQCITKIKDIKYQAREIVWNYDQRFKILLDRPMFHIQDIQHREWFIVGLLPHIHVPLTQQKVMTQAKVVEIAMHLEATPRGGKTSIGLAKV